MTNSTTGKYISDTSPRSAALAAGLGLLAMAVIAGWANFAVVQPLRVPGDPGATAANLADLAGSLRLAAAGFVIVAILDVVVAWGLYIVLRGVNPSLSLLGAWLRLVYAAILAVAINSLFAALRAAALDPALGALFLDGFDTIWQIGLVMFGVHLCVVGYLAWRADFIHWLFGLLLVIAGLGYVVDGFGALLDPGYALNLAVFTFIGEVVFIFWLLIRGPRLPAEA